MESVSKKDRFSRRDNALPTVLFPLPGGPIKTIDFIEITYSST
jgi:hypothetical protein